MRWPKFGTFIDENEADVLAHMDFPIQHRSKIHSTNPLERLNKKIKRRADPVGSRASLSTSERGCDHPLDRRCAPGSERRAALQHRYMPTEAMSELAPLLTDAVPDRLSTEAA